MINGRAMRSNSSTGMGLKLRTRAIASTAETNKNIKSLPIQVNSNLALQRVDTPGKGRSLALVAILEMATGIPGQGAVFFPELRFQQFIFAPHAVPYPCNRPVLHMLLLVSQAQVHFGSLYRMRLRKV